MEDVGGGKGGAHGGGPPPPQGPERPPAFSAPLQGPANVRLPPSIALVEGLGKCIDPKVVLVQLADRFLRLALQLGQRYVTWAAAVVAARREAHAAAMAPPPSGLPGSASSAALAHAAAAAGGAASGSVGGGSGPSSAAEGGAHAGGSGGLAWVVMLPVGDLAVLHHDVAAVAAHVRGVFTPAFVALLQGLGEDAQEVAKGVLLELADIIDAQVSAPTRAVRCIVCMHTHTPTHAHSHKLSRGRGVEL